jgi:hypothetical protein
MPAQDISTISQVLKIRQNGTVEMVTNDAVIQPGQHSFASLDALYAYLIEMFGARAEGEGVTGSFSRIGKYTRRSAEGVAAMTFGDPILDTITSPEGSLVINGQTIDLASVHSPTVTPGGTSGPSGGAVIFDAAALEFKGIVQDAEKWASNDGSYVEYRIGNGKLGFQAWRNGASISNLESWDLGVAISVWNTPANYEAAFINAINFMSVNAPCQQFPAGGHGTISDYSGSNVELSDWGIFAQQPERVAGVCMAQWHHRQFVDVVTAGSGCPNYMQTPRRSRRLRGGHGDFPG